MKNRNSKISIETHERMSEFVRIGRNAVRKAREENHRLGLSNVVVRNGRLAFQMPNGQIITKDPSPAKG